METLYLHEGAPGHHFQISLAQENEALPNFMRFGGNTAYVEGWGLYAETLGRELGVYTDPYQYFGYLDSQLFRAIRLVVDTGIHSKGWSRDQTIQYILDNSSRGRSNATAETERYIAIPGQALAYKIGQLKISELRARAERELGPEVRHPRVPRPGADDRRAAAGGARRRRSTTGSRRRRPGDSARTRLTLDSPNGSAGSSTAGRLADALPLLLGWRSLLMTSPIRTLLIIGAACWVAPLGAEPRETAVVAIDGEFELPLFPRRSRARRADRGQGRSAPGPAQPPGRIAAALGENRRAPRR